MSDMKADWNLTKDNFFVELLANECRILHKPIGGLTKNAWKTIVLEFTGKYGSFYQRDKLINRKKTLMEHYKTLKYLIESSNGFGWDGNKLTASESAWEEMIARTPTVRSYRDKSFPPYDTLCTIFEEGVADEVAYLNGVEAEEADGSSSSSQPPTSTPSRRKARRVSLSLVSSASPRASKKTRRQSKLQSGSKTLEMKPDWNLKKDLFYVELLVNQCQILRKPIGGLTKDAWRTIVREFTAKYGPFYQKDKLINRKRTLMDQYKTLKYLMESQSGFDWDGSKITASESTWDEIIARVPTVRSYRDKSFPPYESLCTIFQGRSSGGRSSLTGVEIVEANDSSGRPNDGHREVPEPDDSIDSSDEQIRELPPLKRSRSNTSGSSLRGSKQRDIVRERDRDADIDVIKRIASAVEKFTETFVEASKHTPFCDVLMALEETPELTEMEYSRTVTVLASEFRPKARRCFRSFACTPSCSLVAFSFLLMYQSGVPSSQVVLLV